MLADDRPGGNTGGTSREEPVRAAAVCGLVLLGACMLVSQVSTTLTVTRAAPPRESDIAGLMHAAVPALVRAGALAGLLTAGLSAALACLEARRVRRADCAVLAVAGVAASLAAWPMWSVWWAGRAAEEMLAAGGAEGRRAFVALVVACAAWTVGSWRDRVRRASGGEWTRAAARLDECMAQIKWGRSMAAVPALVLAGVAAAVAVSAAETVFHVVPVAGRHLGNAPLRGYWAASLSGAVLFGMLQGLALSGVALVALVLFRFGRARRGGEVIGLVAGACVFVVWRYGLALVFEDEIRKLGLTTVANCGMAALGMLYGSLVAWNLAEFCRRGDRPGSARDLVRLTLLAGVLVVAGPLARFGRWQIRAGAPVIIAACTIAGALMAAMLWGSFPTLVDHTSRADVLWAAGVSLTAVVMVCLLLPPRSRRWPLRLVVILPLLIASVAGLASAGGSSGVRLMLYEYSAISKSHLNCLERLCRRSRPSVSWPAPQAPPSARAPRAQSPAIKALRRQKPLIVLVILDACRPDHMSLYGYARKTTPQLDRLKDRLVRFDNAFSQATATSCSLRHLFTGRYSSRYMLQKTGIGPFFTNDLIRAGYHTLHLNITGSDYNGISEEAFVRDMPRELRSRSKLISHCVWDERKKVRVLLDWLDDNEPSGTFALLHMTAAHFPWHRYEGTPHFGARPADAYDAAIAYCDLAMGELLDGLADRELMDRTVLIVSADHGTGLGEHGRLGGFHPYRELVRIPLAMYVPGVPGRRVGDLVGLFDVGPTLASIFAPQHVAPHEGLSLWPLILGEGPAPPRVLFGLSSFEDCYFRVGSDGMHYIWHRGNAYDALFDYRDDPGERELLNDRADVVRKCRAQMAWFYRRGKGRYTNPSHYRCE